MLLFSVWRVWKTALDVTTIEGPFQTELQMYEDAEMKRRQTAFHESNRKEND
jgi:hypothetical protein